MALRLLAAGIAAERIITSRTASVATGFAQQDAARMAGADPWTRSVAGREAMDDAELLVRRHRACVVSVAGVLCSLRTVSGDEVRAKACPLPLKIYRAFRS